MPTNGKGNNGSKTTPDTLGPIDPDLFMNIPMFSGTKQEVARLTPVLQPTHVEEAYPPQALQRVKTEYVTAVRVQKARDFQRVVAAVINEARMAGASFYYYWEQFDKKKGKMVPIEGPSVDMAMSFARNYGNCAVEIEEEETATHFKFKACFIDLESGFTLPRLFRQRKGQSLGNKMDQGRQEDVIYQLAQSKAQRNAIVKAMPEWLKEQAMAEAKAAEQRKVQTQNIQPVIQKILDFFAQYGIPKETIEANRTRPVESWTPEDIVHLRGMATAIKENRISPAEIFQNRPETASPETDESQDT